MRIQFPPKYLALALITVFSATKIYSQSSDSPFWQDVPDPQSQPILRTAATQATASKREIVPRSYRTISLQKVTMQQLLGTVPKESRVTKIRDGAVVSLPLPEGDFGQFKILESPIMEEGLAGQFPE
ncbi:MAG: hypothetical protein EBS59_05925, partial [Verrucomicrobia bacterium]|nr:hypothetical protein [Verrucomicrobiota bacterium]